MVSRLHTKLLRDIRAGFWQILAISVVAGLGVAVYQGLMVAYENQKLSYAISYDVLRFADVTVAMKRAPRSVVRQMAQVPGVRRVEGRIVLDLEVEQGPGRRPRVTGRLVTLPDARESEVNRVRLLEGRLHSGGPRREVLLEASFARKHHYRPGDSLYPVLEGKRVAFQVVGIVSSPEYIYPVQSKQFLMPTPELFGVLFVRQSQVESLLGMSGSINELVFLTHPAAADRVGYTVMNRLRAYGAQDPMTRKEQPSNLLLQSDLDGYRPMAVTMPLLFLGTAALAVSMVLARWAQAQRGQIGFLRASGFRPIAILLHFLELGLVAGAGGGVLGSLLGAQFARWIGAMYDTLLHIPFQARDAHPEIMLTGVLLSVICCGLGAFGPARQAALLPPAEAMRGSAPAQPRLAARIRLPLIIALPLRNLLRRPLRTLGTASGVASSVMLLVLSGALLDSMDHSLGTYLNDIQHYDLIVGFAAPEAESRVYHIGRWPGVSRAEPTLELPVRLGHAGKEEETVVIGMTPGARLRRLPGPEGRAVFPLPGGVLFTNALVHKLTLERGDWLRLEYTQNTREFRARTFLRSGPPVNQPVGNPVYVRMDDLQRRFGRPLGLPPNSVTGALLAVEPAFEAGVRRRLNTMEGVSLVQSKQELVDQINELTAYSKAFMTLFVVFACAMAFAVTYTATDSVLWERTRELATLRTLGFSQGRVALLVSLENMAMAGLGAVGGLWPGAFLADALLNASQTEGFTTRIFVEPQTYVLSAVGPFLLVFIAQWPGLRRIRSLDLAATIRLRDE